MIPQCFVLLCLGSIASATFFQYQPLDTNYASSISAFTIGSDAFVVVGESGFGSDNGLTSLFLFVPE
jgi:hypothetical protein